MNPPAPLKPTPQALGEQFKALRQSSKKSLEELSTATFISVEFLRNLEKGQFSHFPAPVYALGMIENALEYLKLPAAARQEFFSQCSAMLLEEAPSLPAADAPPSSDALDAPPQTPSPVEKTAVEKAKGRWFTFLLYLLLALLLLALASFYYYFNPQFSRSSKNLPFLSNPTAARSFMLYRPSNTFNLKKNDSIKLFFNQALVSLTLRSVSPAQITIALSNRNAYAIPIRQERTFELNQDANPDLFVKYHKNSGEMAVVMVRLSQNSTPTANYKALWERQPHLLVEEEFTLLKEQRKIPIEIYVKAAFSLPIHLSYNIDGKRQNTLNLTPGAHFTLTAEDHLEIQIGNYRSAQFFVNRQPINLFLKENTRFSTTKIIKWLPSVNNENLFDLVIKDYIN